VGEAGSPTTWSNPDLSELVMTGQNNCTEMGDHIRLKSATLLSTNFQTLLYTILVTKYEGKSPLGRP